MHHTKAISEQLGGRLLRVQLDNQVDSDVEVDIGLGGHCDHLTGKGVLIAIQPLGSGNKSVSFLQALEEGVGSALLANSNYITGLDEVAGDVHAATVYGEVAVVHQLASLTAGVSKAQTVDNIVQSALYQSQQVVAGVTFLTSCLLVVVTELLLLNTINEFHFLLLSQLSCILRLLCSSLAAGVLVGSLGVTHCGRRNAQRSATLQHRLHTPEELRILEQMN